MIHNNVFPVRSRRLLHLLLSRSLDFPPKGLREKGMLVGGREEDASRKTRGGRLQPSPPLPTSLPLL